MSEFVAGTQRAYAKEVERLLTAERVAIRTGNWPPWRVTAEPSETGRGWVQAVTEVHHNTVFAVLVRHFDAPGIGRMSHAAMRNCSSTDIAWRDKQRIKDEIFGRERLAVEVFPPSSILVDEANMFHLWVYPEGYAFPFGLHDISRTRGL